MSVSVLPANKGSGMLLGGVDGKERGGRRKTTAKNAFTRRGRAHSHDDEEQLSERERVGGRKKGEKLVAEMADTNEKHMNAKEKN